ncbi:hypothetical protein K491DRAFT_315350 [Lophiostoma macrostomum CBS 122681]|uniref:Uncharacterized protein n=1 Tax=Lophiostoma macrostomum CBS 122681 TaxID=1314788 RepID=A0A6A6TCH4_9PLEO|nr:hypothetical protein K491DRAFT_315350 [Lophiostoma macrostomum CBS 122681]
MSVHHREENRGQLREPNYDNRDRRYINKVNSCIPRHGRYPGPRRPRKKHARPKSFYEPAPKRPCTRIVDYSDSPSNYTSVSVPSFAFVPSAVQVSEGSDEEGEITEGIYPHDSSSVAVSSRSSSVNSVPEVYCYADILRDTEIRLSDRCLNAEVKEDKRFRAQYYTTEDTAYQYDFQLPWVRAMLRHMHITYDSVAVWSLGLLRAGDIIYYLEAFPLGLHQPVQGNYAAHVGGRDCSAAVKLKGRFAIVLDVFGQHAKVAELNTFGNDGLAVAKPQRFWYEYVGIKCSDDRDYQHPSQATTKPLEVGFSCCEIRKTTSVHLITSRISLGNQIMIAGNITSDSLGRLRTAIKKLESRGSR